MNLQLLTHFAIFDFKKPEIETKASRSIPSPVTNIDVSEDDLKAVLFEACMKRIKTNTMVWLFIPIPTLILWKIPKSRANMVFVFLLRYKAARLVYCETPC